jgi:FMN reductase
MGGSPADGRHLLPGIIDHVGYVHRTTLTEQSATLAAALADLAAAVRASAALQAITPQI